MKTKRLRSPFPLPLPLLLPLVLALLILPVACDGNAGEEAGAGPAGGAGTGEQPGPPSQMNPRTMGQSLALQQIQRELEPIQQAALEDDDLAAQLEEVRGLIERAMREENSEAVERVAELEGELTQAQEEGDQDRLRQLRIEAELLQRELMALQSRLIQRPEIRDAVQAFERAQRARMREIDPRADSLLRRMDRILGGPPR